MTNFPALGRPYPVASGERRQVRICSCNQRCCCKCCSLTEPFQCHNLGALVSRSARTVWLGLSRGGAAQPVPDVTLAGTLGQWSRGDANGGCHVARGLQPWDFVNRLQPSHEAVNVVHVQPRVHCYQWPSSSNCQLTITDCMLHFLFPVRQGFLRQGQSNITTFNPDRFVSQEVSSARFCNSTLRRCYTCESLGNCDWLFWRCDRKCCGVTAKKSGATLSVSLNCWPVAFSVSLNFLGLGP